MKRWFAFTGHLERAIDAPEEVYFAIFNVIASQELPTRYATLAEANAAIPKIAAEEGNATFFYRVFQRTAVTGIQSLQGHFPLNPPAVFRHGGTVLTTRGFWDVTASTSGIDRVYSASFAMAMRFMPVSSLYTGFPSGHEEAVDRADPTLPDLLLNPDADYFVYESFVRILNPLTGISHDPPFHSKSRRKFPANSALAVILQADVSAEADALSFTAGVRFRMLVDF